MSKRPSLWAEGAIVRRILWNAGLFVAWIVAVIVYISLLYGVLELLRPSPTKDHGPVAAGSIVVVASFLAIFMRRLWVGLDLPPASDEMPDSVP